MLVSGRFAGEPLTEREETNNLTEREETNNLADALYNDAPLTYDRDGVVHLDDGTETANNGAAMGAGTFAGEPLTEREEANILEDALYNDAPLTYDRDGVVHLDDGTETANNGAAMGAGTFAAAIPSDPDQWYNKNRRLFRTEVEVMRHFLPQAGFNFMKSTGNMFWVIDMKISQTGFTKPWRFLLVYDKNHPNNKSYGGSIRVCPIRPNEEDLQREAREHGRKGVPHLLHDGGLGTYLCTRRREDVRDGVAEASSAVSAAGWAADWALHFELGMRDDRVWNKFCDDQHFYSYKTCFHQDSRCRDADRSLDYRCGSCPRH